MADREDEPTDVFDAVCRLDDLANWLAEREYADEAMALRATSDTLKGYITIRLTP